MSVNSKRTTVSKSKRKANNMLNEQYDFLFLSETTYDCVMI